MNGPGGFSERAIARRVRSQPRWEALHGRAGLGSGRACTGLAQNLHHPPRRPPAAGPQEVRPSPRACCWAP